MILRSISGEFCSIGNIVCFREKNEIRMSISVSPTSANVALGDIILILKCINEKVVQLLGNEVIFEKPCETEERCKEQWFSMSKCSCFGEGNHCTSNKNGPYRKIRSEVIRKIDFSEGDEEPVPDGGNVLSFIFEINPAGFARKVARHVAKCMNIARNPQK